MLMSLETLFTQWCVQGLVRLIQLVLLAELWLIQEDYIGKGKLEGDY